MFIIFFFAQKSKRTEGMFLLMINLLQMWDSDYIKKLFSRCAKSLQKYVIGWRSLPFNHELDVIDWNDLDVIDCSSQLTAYDARIAILSIKIWINKNIYS